MKPMLAFAAGLLVALAWPAPAAAGGAGYTYDSEGVAVRDGQMYKALVSRHPVPGTEIILFRVLVSSLVGPETDFEDVLFTGVDNFTNWADVALILNPDYHAAGTDADVSFRLDGAQTGKSVTASGTFGVGGRAYDLAVAGKV